MSHYHAQGRAAYKRKEYKEAIRLFDRAIGLAASAQLHDNRAACYEKLDELSTALKDAKSAIRISKEDPTGYLRAGRILIKMHKEDVALEIYSHGLKCVKHVGKGYEALRKVHGELLSERSPTKSVDPLAVLPPELAEQVLDYLAFRQLMNICLVSKCWTGFVRSCPKLWRHLDLSGARGGARGKVRNAFVSRVINTAGSKLTKATLNQLFDFDKALAALVRVCPLQELVLIDTGHQGQNLVDILGKSRTLRALHVAEGTQVGKSAMLEIIRDGAARFESIEYNSETQDDRRVTESNVSFPNMRKLAIKLRGWNFSPYFTTIWQGMHQLRSLRLDLCNVSGIDVLGSERFMLDFTRFHQLEVLGISMVNLPIHELHFPPTLSELRIGGPGLTGRSAAPPGLLLQNWVLPQLKEIEILATNGIIGAAALAPVMDRRPTHDHVRMNRPVADVWVPSKLSRLSLRDSYGIEGNGRSEDLSLQHLLEHSRLGSLVHLGLTHSLALGDDAASVIAKCQPNLQSLDLTMTSVSGVGVKELVEGGSLKSLVLNDCTKLSMDAVEWARSRGVHVQCRSSDSGRGGRKIRQ